jgi:membrane carboxypeptidase/penicillin-binding protein PbpC
MREYTNELDISLIEKIIRVEDRRFYSHYGIDIFGKISALRENYIAGSVVR